MKTLDERRRITLSGLLAEKAHNDLGIYPQSIKCGSNPYEKRSDYQEGWNDAIMAHIHKCIAYDTFIDSLSDNQRNALETLLFEETIILSERNDKVDIWMCVNDTFFNAADSEEIKTDDLPLLASLYENYGWDGLIAWVAKQRNMEPIERRFKKTDKYLEAMKCLELNI